jgi:hypothetical protein
MSKTIWELDWVGEYERCPEWREPFLGTRGGTPEGVWPKGFHRADKFLVKENRICVPTGLQGRLIYDHHQFLGHVGYQRLWQHMGVRYDWGDFARAQKLAKTIMGVCESCQACQRPHTLRAPIQSSPVPPAIMVSVAMDLFHLPTVNWEGQSYDTLIVCVDRHSGWVVAIPALNLGLTGAKVAQAMVRHQWRPFGVPSLITSDQGSQFVGSWWQTLCALLGVRQAFSHAYHHRANGRAERAGQQLFERLRRIQIEGEFSWIEALPQILDRLHDTPGEGGLSPYQILFGRERPLASLPYTPHRK